MCVCVCVCACVRVSKVKHTRCVSQWVATTEPVAGAWPEGATWRMPSAGLQKRPHTNVYKRPKNHLKNEQRCRDAAAKKRANTSGVGEIINYCEDIYIPPYNNTH